MLLIMMVSIGGNPVHAQGISLPGAADSSRVDENNRLEILPEFRAQEGRPAADSRLDAPEGSENLFLTIRAVSIDGVTAYKQDDLLPYYQGVIGKTVSLKSIYDIALEIDKRYKQDGYILSRAFVPPQDVTEGYITIRVKEVRIGTISRAGNAPESEIVENIVRKIQSSGPLNIHEMESKMLLLNDLPGVKATAVLKPASRPSQAENGAVDLEIAFEEKLYENNTLAFNNHGSRYLGPWQGSALAGMNHNFLLPHQQTEVGGNVSADTDELKYGYFNHVIPLNEWGTRLSLGGSYTRTQPGYRLEPLEIEGNSYGVSMSVSHPLIRSRQENLNISAGLDYSHSETDILATQLFSDDLRVMRLALDYDSFDSWMGSNHINFEISRGLGVFGASEKGDSDLSRAEGDPEFIKARLTLERLQRLGSSWSLYGLANFQLSADPLLSSEEFGFGGQRIGRAYDASEITGDHGAGALLELQYGGLAPRWDMRFQPYAFYDIGKVWNKDTGSESISASSAGLGIRMQYKDNVTFDFSAALPLTKAVEAHSSSNDNDPRFFFSISTTF